MNYYKKYKNHILNEPQKVIRNLVFSLIEYIDACTSFITGSQMKTLKSLQTFAEIIVFIISLFLGAFVTFSFSKK